MRVGVRVRVRVTSGAIASGSTALSLAALWHHSGSAHSYEREPSQKVVIATRRGWPDELEATRWRVANMSLQHGYRLQTRGCSQ